MKKTLIIFIAVIVLGGLLFTGKIFYDRLNAEQARPITAIPDNATFMLALKNPLISWEDLKFSQVWRTIEKVGGIAVRSRQIDETAALLQSDETVAALLNDQEVYISCHFAGHDRFEFLFVAGVPVKKEQQGVKAFLERTGTQNVLAGKRIYEGEKIYTVQPRGQAGTFFFSIVRGVFIGSFYDLLVEDAIRQMKNNKSLMDDVSFKRVRRTAGKNVDANLYVNYRNFARLMALPVSKDYRDYVRLTGGFSDWAEFDLTVKEKMIMLNGYSAASDSVGCYFNLYPDDAPDSTGFEDVLPYQTSFILYKNVGNIEQYIERFNAIRNDQGSVENLEKLKGKYGLDVIKHFGKWMDDEFVLAWLPNTAADSSNGSELEHKRDVLFIKATDVALAKKSLIHLSNKVNGAKTDTVNYRNKTIGHLNLYYLMQTMFGPVYSGLKTNYFTFLGGYVVFANDLTTLEKVINGYLYGRTLRKNATYMAFAENIAEKANIYLYCNGYSEMANLSRFLTDDYDNSISSSLKELKKIEAFGYQMIRDKNLYFTNICVKYNDQYQEQEPVSWETSLDTALYGKPYVVKDHRDNNNKIIVFDVNKGMYLLDDNGKRVWKITLSEQPQSDVFVIDYYRNNRYQYVFNSTNYIFGIDRNGNNLEGYPISFKEPATNGMVVLDYEGTGDYRYLVACGNKLYNLTKEGKRVEGWHVPVTPAHIEEPMQYINTRGQEYLAVADKTGELMLLNRRGILRIELKQKIKKARNSEVYLGDFNGVLKFVTSTKDGKIIYILQNGDVQETVLQPFSESHYFIFEDVNDDAKEEFIFVDRKKLSIFGQDKEPLLDFICKGEIDRKPAIIRNNGIRICLSSSVSGELLFVSTTGELSQGSPLRGGSEMFEGQLIKSGQTTVLIGSGSTLLNYPIEE